MSDEAPLPHLAAFIPQLPRPLVPIRFPATFHCASSTTYYDCSSPTQSHRNICAADKGDPPKCKSSSVILIVLPALCRMNTYVMYRSELKMFCVWTSCNDGVSAKKQKGAGTWWVQFRILVLKSWKLQKNRVAEEQRWICRHDAWSIFHATNQISPV